MMDPRQSVGASGQLLCTRLIELTGDECQELLKSPRIGRGSAVSVQSAM
jgi:hypothetical protein